MRWYLRLVDIQEMKLFPNIGKVDMDVESTQNEIHLGFSSLF